MAAPYHVRLAVSQYGEQFRAELFTEDLGDTEGDLLAELPPSIAEWVPYLAQGADLPPDAARQLGKDLFAALLGQPENAKKWSEVLTQAARNKQPIRLLIDATTEAVRDLPYGLLCEPHDDWFLFREGHKQSIEFVRILRRCSPRPLKFRDRLRVLVAVAEPASPDVPPFNAPLRLQKFAAAVSKDVDLVICGPDGPKPLAEIAPNPESADPTAFTKYTKTTRDALRKALTGDYDVLHLLAHGHGAGVLLCTADGAPVETTASELGEWCGAGKSSLAFLQVCKAGQTGSRGGFGGVAQQLLNPRGGNLAAVVASTFPLDAEHSTDAAVGFYRQLAAGKSPEEALTADRAETDWCWAFLELWARPGALGGTQQRAAFQFVSPYRGLSSFGEQDADLFFGRKAEIAELLQVLRAEPAVAVVGDSGSGKTSLLQAGLVHAVRRDGLAGSDRWRIVFLRPGYRPAQALLAALTGSHADPSPDALKAALRADAQPLLIVFDQFEEVFTLARDRAEAQMLIAALADAVERQRDRMRLVIGMRSEFLGQAASVPGLSRLIRRPWVLRPPGADDLRDIVGGPAQQCGYTFQGPLADGNPAHATGLLDRILADPLLARVEGGLTAAPLPLLQFALERLWLKAVEKGVTEFTHAQFDEIGGMGKAIAQHAEAVFQAAATATEAGAQGRALAEQIITSLVSTQGTRQPRGRDALQAETGSPEAARAVVDYLVGERLLTVRSDPEDSTKSLVDLSHEALIQNWERLRGWLAEDPQGRAMREEYRKAAEQWESGFAGVQPRSWFGLPGADVARNYLAWIDANKPRLSPVQQEFARAMRDMLVRLRRRRQLVMASLGVFALMSCVLAIYAIEQAGKARTNAAAAEKNAGEARENETKAKAEEDKAKAEKQIALENAASLALEKGIQTCEEGRPRVGILSIAYSLQICPPDAHDLRRVILTNLAAWGPHLMCLDEVRTLGRETIAAEPTGKYALLVSIAGKLHADGVVLIFEFQLFDVDKNAVAGPPFRVQGNRSDDNFEFRSPIDRVKLLSSGMVLFTGGGRSSVWNAITGKPVGKWIHHGPGVAALSPDGKLVAGCNGQGDMRLYDAVTGVARDGVFQHLGKVNSVAFSADGRFIATGCGRRPDVSDKEHATTAGGVVHLYEVGATGAAPTTLKWPPYRVPDIVTCVQISPDLRRVTGGGFELRSWTLDKGDLISGSTRHNPESTDYIEFDPKNPSSFIASNPSGSLQIMHSDDSVRLSGEQLTPQGWLAGVGFRPDGRVFTANGDGTVRIWNRPGRGDATEKLGREFKPSKAESILCVAFHPTGTSIALGSRTGVVFVYDLDHPDASPKEFRCAFAKERRQPVTHVGFSADGSRVIAHDQLLHTFVFETAGRDEPLVAKGGHRPLGVADDGRTAVFHSRTPNQYVIGQLDPAVDVPTGPKLDPHGELATITDEADNWFLIRASRVAFNPDRSLVALLNGEGLIYLFRTATGEPVGKPLEHVVEDRRDGMHSVEFSAHGDFLLTRSPRARGIWAASTGTNINLLPNRIGIQVARFSPSGKFVVGGTNFSQGQAWTNTGQPAVPLPLVHEAQVWGVAVDPTDERIITASFDHTARIWDRATGRPLSPPLTHQRAVSEATFSPDGKFALTGSWDGTARLWPVPRPLDDDEKRITAWVETMTGLRVEPNAGGELLNPEEWRARKAELDRLGGPPINFVK
jgi:WD40 repeat protein